MTAVSLSAMSPAFAGGSWLEPIQADIRSGDVVTLVGFSGFGPREDPDVSPDDPFYAHVEVDESQRTGGYPNVHSGTLPLGRVVVTETGECCWQNYRLHITFRVPELPDGAYSVVVCNDPCTTNFGELIGGTLFIGNTPRVQDQKFRQAFLNDPLVAELVGEQTLALTGPTRVHLVWFGFGLFAAGLFMLRFSQRHVSP